MESSDQPARVLVVANRTAATPALIAAVRERAERGPALFTLLVPNTSSGLERIADPEDHADTEAQATLELALPLLEDAVGGEVTGMVGAPEPLDAIQDAVNLHGFDEIILSTLPQRVSRWLKLDLPSKLTGLGLPVTTVTAERARGARRLALGDGDPVPLLDAGADRALRDREHDHRDRQALSPSRRSRPPRAGERRALRQRLAVEDRARHVLGQPRALLAEPRQLALERVEAGVWPGGRLTASWASEATTCTIPSRSIAVVKRRTVEPKAPVIEPAVICTSTPFSTSRSSRIRVALEGRAALRVGEQHAEPARQQVEHDRLERADDGRERALDQQVGAAAEREAAQRVVVEVGEPPDRDLPAGQHLERDLRLGQRRAQHLEPGGHPRGVDARVVVDVRRGEDRPRAGVDRRAGQLERPLERAGDRRRGPGGCASAGRSRVVHL